MFCIIVRYLEFSAQLYWSIIIISSIIILLLSPIADPNKPIDAHDKKKYRKLIRLIVCIEVVVILAIFILLYDLYLLYFIAFSFVQLSILLIAGFIVFPKQ